MELLLDWPELDALADELRRTLARGGLQTLPSVNDPTNTLTPERLARIVLADIYHLHNLDSTSEPVP